MKIEWKTCFRIAVSIFLLYLAVTYWTTAAGLLSTAFAAALPLLLGCGIAYVINIPMTFYEKHYFIRWKENTFVKKSKRGVCLIAAILTLIGIVCIIIGSDLVVNNATEIAIILGVSQKFISLTIVSIGTGLPELVTSIVASKKGEEDLAIGNVVGSSIFNIGCVLGLSIAIFGGITSLTFTFVDLLMLMLSALVLFITAIKDSKITHREGTTYLVLYAMYLVYLICSVI